MPASPSNHPAGHPYTGRVRRVATTTPSRDLEPTLTEPTRDDQGVLSCAPTVIGLRWGLKRSFIHYVAQAPGGRALLGAGATAANERELLFEPVFPDDLVIAPTEASLAFRGAVTFTAHHGMLAVRIADPCVTIAGTEGHLSVIDPYQRAGGDARIRLATFDITAHRIADGQQQWNANNVRLTLEGCVLFSDVYSPGELLEPFEITLPTAAAPASHSADSRPRP